MVSPARYRYSTFRVSAKAAQFQGSGRTLQARDKHIILQAHERMLRQKAQSPLPPLLLAERGFPYSDDTAPTQIATQLGFQHQFLIRPEADTVHLQTTSVPLRIIPIQGIALLIFHHSQLRRERTDPFKRNRMPICHAISQTLRHHRHHLQHVALAQSRAG